MMIAKAKQGEIVTKIIIETDCVVGFSDSVCIKRKRNQDLENDF